MYWSLVGSSNMAKNQIQAFDHCACHSRSQNQCSSKVLWIEVARYYDKASSQRRMLAVHFQELHMRLLQQLSAVSGEQTELRVLYLEKRMYVAARPRVVKDCVAPSTG